LIFGVYDPNVFGNRIELGAQYETLEGAPSYVVWHKNPRFLNSLFFYDLQLWNTKRIRLKYDQNVNSPQIIKALLLHTEKIYLAFGKEFLNNYKLRFSFERQSDKFSTDIVPQKFLDQVVGQTIPDDVNTNFLGLQFEYNKLKSLRNVQTGHSLNILYRLGLVDKFSDQNFNSLKLDYIFHDLVGTDFIFSQRIQLGFTDTNILQHWYYLGGLESIRGYADNRFASKNYWLSNSEIRHFTLENSNLTMQTVFFVDALGIDESDRNIQNFTALSSGLGARFIFPKVYRLVLRFDYAKPIINVDEQFINFGIQQFF
jgi:outer membrane protein assembly factor BamA